MKNFYDAVTELCVCPNWEKPHLIRYKMTYSYLNNRGLLPDGPILDIGGPSPMRAALKACGREVHDTGEADLRYPFAYAAKYRLIIALEVLEHLADQEEIPEITIPYLKDENGQDWLDRRATFRGTGQLCFLQECRKLLAPDGVLVLSTPNPNGWCCLAKHLKGARPAMWEPHIREVNQHEVEVLAKKSKLRIVHKEGFECWPQLAGGDKRWRALMAQHMDPGTMREDCIVYTLTATEGSDV
jgi:SAM-dependent methyltransferase